MMSRKWTILIDFEKLLSGMSSLNTLQVPPTAYRHQTYAFLLESILDVQLVQVSLQTELSFLNLIHTYSKLTQNLTTFLQLYDTNDEISFEEEYMCTIIIIPFKMIADSTGSDHFVTHI